MIENENGRNPNEFVGRQFVEKAADQARSAALARLDAVDEQFAPSLRTRLDSIRQTHEFDELHDPQTDS